MDGFCGAIVAGIGFVAADAAAADRGDAAERECRRAAEDSERGTSDSRDGLIRCAESCFRTARSAHLCAHDIAPVCAPALRVGRCPVPPWWRSPASSPPRSRSSSSAPATSWSTRSSARGCARGSSSSTSPAARTPGGAGRPAASARCWRGTGLLFALTSLNAFVVAARVHARPRRLRGRDVRARLRLPVLPARPARLASRPAASSAPSAPCSPRSGCSCWRWRRSCRRAGRSRRAPATCPENALRVIDGAAEAGRALGDVANAITVASFVAVTGLLLAADAGIGSAGPAHAGAARSSRWARCSCRSRRTPSRARSPTRRPPVASAAVAVTVLSGAGRDPRRPGPGPPVRRPPPREPRRRRGRHAGDRRGRRSASSATRSATRR